MAVRPRRRAYNENARVFWPEVAEKRVLGFAGYKVGMTNVSFVDDSDSPTKGQEIVSSATIVEVPPMLVYGARLYQNGNSIGDIFASDEKILKSAGFNKMPKSSTADHSKADEVRLLAVANPETTGFSKKHIGKMELGCGGKTMEEKITHAKSLFGKEVKVSEVFKLGEYVDVVSVTKGHGWQGAVKRFGVAIQRRKATGKRRHVGTLGQWHPAYVLYTVPQAGQTGYHQRTELNKRILKMGQNPKDINPVNGFRGYGLVKGEYILLRGSIPGPSKRMVKLRLAVRPLRNSKEVNLTHLAK